MERRGFLAALLGRLLSGSVPADAQPDGPAGRAF
jgi:hypothetical protein